MFGSCINNGKEFRESDLLHGDDADDLQNFPESLRQVQPAFGDGNQKIGADRRPDLHANAVERSAVKSAQAQVLFDPPKEQFDGPSTTVDLGDDQRVQVELVGQENQRVARFRIYIVDSPKHVGVARVVWGRGNQSLFYLNIYLFHPLIILISIVTFSSRIWFFFSSC